MEKRNFGEKWWDEERKIHFCGWSMDFDMIMYFLSSHFVLELVICEKESGKHFFARFTKAKDNFDFLTRMNFFYFLRLSFNFEMLTWEFSWLNRRFYFWCGCDDEKMKSTSFSGKEVEKVKIADLLCTGSRNRFGRTEVCIWSVWLDQFSWVDSWES